MSGLHRFSVEETCQIHRLYRSGHNYAAIARLINYGHSFHLCTPSGVRKLLTRSNQIKQPKIKSGRKRKLGSDAIQFINNEMLADRELSAAELQKKLITVFGLTVSVDVIRNERKRLGWITTTPSYCQMVRHENKEKRLLFCVDILSRNDTFDDVIFTDECTVKCERFISRQFRLKGEPSQFRPRPKHPLSVHVWAGISKNGATQVAIFTGILNSVGYHKILENYLKPFIQIAYPTRHRLWQDNDPKHVSKATKAWMTENDINHWPTPPESPDLNPIEHMWAELKYHIRRRVKPQKKEELLAGIREFWLTVTREKCQRYINHIPKAAHLIIQNKGGPAGE